MSALSGPGAINVLRWELFKLARRRASYVGFWLCLAFVVVVLVGFQLSSFRGLRRFAKNLPIDPLALVNGPFFANFILLIGFFALLPLLAATLAGSQLAGEAREGTLRALLVRPPSRPTIYLAKVAASYLWLQGVTFFLVGLALLVGRVALGGGSLLVFVWEQRAQGPWLASTADWVPMLAVASVGAALSLFVIASLAMMLSALVDTPVVAHVGCLGAFFISSVLQRLPPELLDPDLKDLLPTTHMNFWHELYRLWRPGGGFDAARFWGDVAWCGGFTAVFLAVGLYAFTRRDVTS